MVGVVVGNDPEVYIVGHGLNLNQEFDLGSGIKVSPKTIKINDSFGSSGARELQTMASVMAFERIANFSLVVHDDRGGEHLATKAWNALWLFNLLSLACRSPIISLYSATGRPPKFSLANRNLFIRPLPVIEATKGQLSWAQNNLNGFHKLLDENRFMIALRYYGNAQYLVDDDAKIMLLWAGIESLLDVDTELRKRIALHAAILIEGDASEKIEYFKNVKKAYDIRSRVVHGSGPNKLKLETAAQFAGEILLNLLRRVVELGRLPKGSELDDAAASTSIK